ncbi:carbamoyl-phosphate synthase large subunit [Halorutilales archaeon Cl-col2-1]
MPTRTDLDKVLLIGSGPIVIGQAAEFDYSGSQACRAIQEEGIEVVLVNSNPATIMTDPDIADEVYLEPLEPEYVARIIEKEDPDGLIAGLGGQTGLNVAAQLADMDVLEENDVELLGTDLETIHLAEDRQKFYDFIQDIGEKTPRSMTVTSLDEVDDVIDEFGLPVIVRTTYTLGGSGSGVVDTREELEEKVRRGLKLSMNNEVTIDESVEGWKEFEYEVIRDSTDTCITICNMENIDPMGIHTGESTVVTPSQTISDDAHQRMRSTAIKVIRELGIVGGCNIQFAWSDEKDDYTIVEVNPRVSRSSALASKATGYPIARVTAKISVGKSLDEIENDVTKETPAAFEPTIDYVVTKIPRWPFDKFPEVDRTIGSAMKSTGEVMSIGRTFEESYKKALRSLDIVEPEFESEEEVRRYLETPTDIRNFAVLEAFRHDIDVEEVAELTGFDEWYVARAKKIVEKEREIAEEGDQLTEETVEEAKQMGFTDDEIAENAGDGLTRGDVDELKGDATYKMVDTCAAEFEAETPYYYSSWESKNEIKETEGDKALIVGAGPIRIGQGVEFDYCTVHAIQALRERDIEAQIVNNNPETVSTDYDTSDKLFFDPLTLEDVANIVETEEIDSVMTQFGGQTSVNLAVPLSEEIERKGLDSEVVGTSPDSMDLAEDRDRFNSLMDEIGVPQPEGGTGYSEEEALEIADEIGYPVLVRPSYVLGGRAMEIVWDELELREYMEEAVRVSPDHPILIDDFLADSVELDVDAVSDGEDVLIGAIMEHIEEAGVHSGDSACVIPPQNIGEDVLDKARDYVRRIARALDVEGLLNVQMAVQDDEVYVLEANPRSSRTIPFVSKSVGVPIAKIAAGVMMGASIDDFDYEDEPYGEHVTVKEVDLPFDRLPGVSPTLSPEMKSTGEVMGVDYDFGRAFYKAELAAGNALPDTGKIFISVRDKDKDEIVPVARKLDDLGFDLVATEGTQAHLKQNGIEAEFIEKVHEASPNVVDLMKRDEIDLIINTPDEKTARDDGADIRRAAVDRDVTYITTVRAADAAADAIKAARDEEMSVKSIEDYINESEDE